MTRLCQWAYVKLLVKPRRFIPRELAPVAQFAEYPPGVKDILTLGTVGIVLCLQVK